MASRSSLAAVLLAALIPAASLRADEGPDASAVLQEKLARLLDRWNDDAPEDRLKKAVDLCEKQLKEQPDDAQAMLELARFKLARNDADGAVDAALKADVLSTTQPDRARVAKALHLLAFSQSSAARESTEAKVDEFKKKFVDLYKKLETAAGGKEAADALLAAERERRDYAATINELGRAPKALARKDTEGKDVKLDAYLGKVVIVDFWSASYEPYEKEIANTLAVYEKNKDRVEVIGISLDNDRAALDAFVKAHSVPWRQLFSGKGLADDTARDWKVQGVRRYVIDHDGKVRFVNVRGDGLAAAVKLLVERAQKPNKK